MIGPGEILSSLNILQQLGKYWNWLRARRHPPLESVPARFIRLFENHGVHRNQIPRYFGQGLTLRDMQDETSLLAKLDDPLLDDVCAHFAVNREWLDGADDVIYDIHDFYKQPEDFKDFINTLKADNPEGELRGTLLAPSKRGRDATALLVLEETVGYIEEQPISRYHLCKHERFGYWKARAYLSACIAIAWKHSVHIKGLRMPHKAIQRVIHGTSLPFWPAADIGMLAGKKWYPEKMALVPETYLEGIDPERNSFGIKAALQLWLQLEAQGLMDVGLEKNPRPLFLQALEHYSRH